MPPFSFGEEPAFGAIEHSRGDASAYPGDGGLKAEGSKVERLFLIQVISYDWNCPQYITPRFTAAEVEKYAAPLKARVAELEAQLAGILLRAR